jgi:hypothetical protein
VFLAAAFGPLATLGCDRPPQESRPAGEKRLSESTDYGERVFGIATNNLSRLDEFNPQEMLGKIVDQLNQWLQEQEITGEWSSDPLLDTLPEAFHDQLTAQRLSDLKLRRSTDAEHLKDAAMFRDLARVARGDQINDLSRATRLFDWTVRNVQLDGRGDSVGDRFMRMPGQTVYFGRGQAIDRAWVFTLLARQQDLDVVMLAYRDSGGELQPWVPALLTGGELYLFEPMLGMPIPGTSEGSVATLTEAASDPAVLGRLDVDSARRYPVAPDDLAEVVALVEASPGFLSRRMQIVESHLSGDRRIRLYVEPSRIADAAREHPRVKDAAIWTLPYETRAAQREMAAVLATPADQISEEMTPHVERVQQIMLPFEGIRLLTDEYQPIVAMLGRARLLHLKGEYESDDLRVSDVGAIELYTSARIARDDIDDATLAEEQKDVLRGVKQDASYWLGLVSFERGQYQPAINHLANRTLKSFPNGQWVNGARYNLGRSYEEVEDYVAAVEQYEADTSPQRYGNLLRAKQLREQHLAQQPPPADDDTSEAAAESDVVVEPATEPEPDTDAVPEVEPVPEVDVTPEPAS